MLNITDVRDLIKRVYREIPKGYSESAEEITLMIAAHESHLGTYLKQIIGDALGFTQIEPDTHDDIWEHGDTCQENAKLLGIERNVEALEYDLRYCLFMTRQLLFMKTEPLPEAHDVRALAAYAKKHWNTKGGSASIDDYIDDYYRYTDAEPHSYF